MASLELAICDGSAWLSRPPENRLDRQLKSAMKAADLVGMFWNRGSGTRLSKSFGQGFLRGCRATV